MQVMALLLLDSSKPIPVCVGCSQLLAELKYLIEIGEYPLSGDDEPTCVHYTLAPGITIADCQYVVRLRHPKTPAWGELQ